MKYFWIHQSTNGKFNIKLKEAFEAHNINFISAKPFDSMPRDLQAKFKNERPEEWSKEGKKTFVWRIDYNLNQVNFDEFENILDSYRSNYSDEVNDLISQLNSKIDEYVAQNSVQSFDELIKKYSENAKANDSLFHKIIVEGDLLNKRYVVKNDQQTLYFDLMDNHKIGRQVQVSLEPTYKKNALVSSNFIDEYEDDIAPEDIGDCRARIFGELFFNQNTARIQIKATMIEKTGSISLVKEINKTMDHLNADETYRTLLEKRKKERADSLCLDFERKIALITDGSSDKPSKSTSEFYKGINSKKKKALNLEEFYVSSTDTDEIISKIQNLDDSEKYQAICIIKSSNSNSENLAPFCNENLVKAELKCKTPIITGIGPAKTDILFSEFSHHDAKSPLEAGKFIYRQYCQSIKAEADQSKQEEDQELINSIIDDNAIIIKNLQKENDNLKAENDRLRNRLCKYQKEYGPLVDNSDNSTNKGHLITIRKKVSQFFKIHND